MAPGAANVAPPKDEALRLATFVVLATTRGGLPVETVDVIAPVAEMVVKAAAAGVVPPIAPGAAKVALFRDEAFKFGMLVVLAIISGGVPVETVEVNCPVAESVVKAPLDGTVFPIAVGDESRLASEVAVHAPDAP